jgi:hypothetical protein
VPAAQARARGTARRSIAINRTFDVLDAAASPRRKLAQAAARWGARVLLLDDVRIDARALAAVAATPADEPLERALREAWRRPVDLDDLLLFLDDVLAALGAREVVLPAGRARSAGVLVHPDDVFLKDRPRLYARRATRLSIERPKAALGGRACRRRRPARPRLDRALPQPHGRERDALGPRAGPARLRRAGAVPGDAASRAGRGGPRRIHPAPRVSAAT